MAIVAATIMTASCSLFPPLQGSDTRLTILSYNVQNLFDGVDDGTEYPAFDPDRGAWSAERAEAKAGRIARVIRSSVRGGPDILCLQEVEHRGVVDALVRDHLRRLDYVAAAATDTPGTAVEVGLVSRVPISRVRVHRPVLGWPPAPEGDGHKPTDADEPLRPVLEAELHSAAGPLHLFVNHWKSKSEGPRETEPFRRAAARVIVRRMLELRRRDPAAAIVVCGDLNEGPDAFAEAGGAYVTALMPFAGELRSSPGSPELPRPSEPSRPDAAGSLRISADPDALRGRPGAVLWSPWSRAGAAGSYYFRGRWRRLDHTLLAPGLLDDEGWRFVDFEVVQPPFALTSEGLPRASRRPSRTSGAPASVGGYSDHLPVLLTLER